MANVKYTVEQIWELVMTNDYFCCAALSKMLDRQTSDEQGSGTTKYRNGRGFNGRDAKFLTSLAWQVRRNKHKGMILTNNQLQAARKCLYKYRKQITEIANELAEV